MNSAYLFVLALYLGSLPGNGLIKQADATPPAQTTTAPQTEQTPAQTTQPAAQPDQTPAQTSQPAAQADPTPAQTTQPVAASGNQPPAQVSQTPAAQAAQPPAQSAQPPATPALGVTPTVDSYVIGASDVLTITVWKEPTLSGVILVRPDGMISMALIGDVQASGLTPTQLSDAIATKLKKYIQDPNVSVVVTQIHSKVVYLIGEVAKKGPVEMTPGMTLIEAIASAGGLTDFANQRKIYILRTESGTQQRIPVRYKDALKGDGTLNLALKPGDTIVVP